MAYDGNIVGWFTRGGEHIPIRSSGKDTGAVTTNSYVNNLIKGKIDEGKEKRLKRDIEEWEKKVKDSSSNKTKPFEKEEYNEAKARKRGKIDDLEAKECHQYAEKVYAEAERHEPEITKDMVSIVEDNNGKMYGLDFRMKQPTSLTAKIGADAKDDGISFQKAAENVKDAVRYTMVFDEDTFTDNVNKARQELANRGYKEYRMKNFYKMYEDGESCQKAIQAVYETSDGYKFELQFHTVNSQGVKEVNHPDYEIWREKTTAQYDKDRLYEKMKKSSSHVRNPKGVLTIK